MTQDNNIPQGYKQTELGIIPEDWEIMTFDELGTFSKGSGVSRAESNTGNIPCIRYGELYTHHNDYIKAYNSYISKTVASKAKLLQYGDVLFAASGETKEEIGKSAAFVNSCEAYAGGDIIILSTNSKLCDAKYIGYASNAPYVTKQKATKGQGDAVVHITSEAIKTISINIPPIAEQRAIAEALSDVDGLIAALDKKIAKKRLLKQGAMQQLLTSKKRLSSFTDEWVEGYIKEYFEITAGGDVDMSRFSSVKTSRCKYPIYSNSLDDKGLYGYTSLPNYSAGCVTITGRGTLGHAEYRDEAFDAIVRLIVMTPKGNNICAQFIKELLNLAEPFIFESTGVPQLTAPQVGSTKIKVPQKIEEQRAIATILSDMDKEIADLETQRNKYRLLKSGMMQKLLIGQIRLKTE